MFTYRLESFFLWMPERGFLLFLGILAVCTGLALILFFVSEYKKRNARQRKIYGGAAWFFLLTGLYSVFYLVKILYAQELLQKLM